ncbi:uncharacterized protein LOC118514487 [Anopheles stephensi]|uniref:uncharacterized protein LOC118514487 n=1 Tax=Anopheles stephensi TaxID=30069 RepID=UPI001658B9BA|nr:uncharacterized protein LOC118514487 [Anopheles stephensi]
MRPSQSIDLQFRVAHHQPVGSWHPAESVLSTPLSPDSELSTMEVDKCLNFTKNIRTHAAIVGTLFTFGTIVCIVQGAQEYGAEAEQLSEESQNDFKYVLLVLGILNAFIAIVYWIGFLKKNRLLFSSITL